MTTKSENDETDESGHPNCGMPHCVGNPSDETHAVRGPSDELMEMCDGCLEDGWRGAVTVLD